MPEGPELARSRDFLRGLVLGKELTSLELVGGRYGKSPPAGMVDFSQELWNGAQAPIVITDVGVKGKFMWWELRRSDVAEPWFMWCTYGMSGMWSTLPIDKHTAVVVMVNEPGAPSSSVGSCYVQFRDPRHFGTVKFVKGRKALDKKLATLGPDMLNDPPDLQQFWVRLLATRPVAPDGKPSSTLAEILMRQDIVSGVGNYVKAEALHRAKLSPHRTVSSLDAADVQRLYHAIIDVMRASYDAQGATVQSYRTGEGERGKAQNFFRVYGREHDEYGHEVTRETTGDGRTTHWCRSCQA